MRKLMAVFGLMVTVGNVAPAMATTRAYVLIETAPDKAAVVRDSLGKPRKLPGSSRCTHASRDRSSSPVKNF